MSYGPNPWHQKSWDARAAGNFICGGAGSGLIVFTALSGAVGLSLAGLMLAGLALIGLGLISVSLELGRPLRALKVLRNPRTSWMAREAWTATLLFPVGLAAAFGVPGLPSVAAVLALAFVYCQARLLQAAKGIPAWREPLLRPLFVTTGLAEGGGLFLLAGPVHGRGTLLLAALFGALLLARLMVWLAYRRRLSSITVRGATAALDQAGRVLQLAGTWVPLALLSAIAIGATSDTQIPFAAALAGLAATAAGAYLKFTVVTRAGFNQGFALAHLPVRGVRP